jgi:hypothetical protein
MNTYKQRIAIAEACGWKDIKDTNHEDVDIESRSIIYWSGLTGVPPEFIHYENRIKIPDYLNDLNAMHEAEKSLDDVTQRGDYWDYLSSLTHEGFEMCHATAAQRAEAFLRTLGKWEDDK